MERQEKSRTEYSARNTVVAISARVLAILCGFIVRVIFTHTLSQEYVGINGLFTDIISILALSELGIGTAITFSLYRPIAEGDIEKQKTIMKLYQKFYNIVALVVLVLGLLLIPFMDYLIKDHDSVDHLILIYLMYLTSSVLSYFMIYKKTLIDAHQLSYIGVVYHTVFLLIQYVGQALLLIFTHNFILYLTLLILCTLGNNLMVSFRADRLYPFLKDKDVKPLLPAEKQEIFTNIKAMLLHKIGNVLVNNTDNLLLSSLIGTIAVGCYSNYYLIIGSVRQVLEQCFQGIAASVGNLGVTENKDKVKKIFMSTFFLGQWIYGMVAITMYEAIDFFVGRSFGSTYVFDCRITLVLCINFYLLGMRQATLVFRDSIGLFRYDKYKAIAEAVINLIVSIVLGKYCGTIGIFIGTSISMILTSLWVEPFVLYKYKLKESCLPYFGKFFLYAGVTALLWWGEDYLCHCFQTESWGVWLLRFCLCMLITNLVYLLLYHRTKEFKLLWTKGMALLKNKKTQVENKRGERKKAEFAMEELLLFDLLRKSLLGTKEKEKRENLPQEFFQDPLWGRLYALADSHKVSQLLTEEVSYYPIAPSLHTCFQDDAIKTSLQNYRLLFLSKTIYDAFTKENCPIVFLKGAATGFFYPEPELRKTGDVDFFLLHEEDRAKASLIMKKLGYKKEEEQRTLHHIAFVSTDKIEVEMHLLLAEPFDNKPMNDYLEALRASCQDQVVYRNLMGFELPTLKDGYHAYELLLHMLQHFLRSGFGIKLLCDWVVFWNRPVAEEEKAIYLRLVEESKVKGFSDMITLACCKYLGLKRESMEWMNLSKCNATEFMREVLVAEEFGKSSKDRMVALRGNSLVDYIREFHHQMRLNYPKAGKLFLLWPILWCITLCRFLYNNKKIRGISFWAIMHKAGDRGKLIKQMKIFNK